MLWIKLLVKKFTIILFDFKNKSGLKIAAVKKGIVPRLITSKQETINNKNRMISRYCKFFVPNKKFNFIIFIDTITY
jgi:hypothetical protein